ncbi:MAG: M12 family metallopeptidase [Granulosicoccus sp.]
MPWRIDRHFLLLVLVFSAAPLLAAQKITLSEGDILVATGPTARAIALPADSQIWAAGIVPYTIDPALSANSINAITTAIERWNEVGGITLLPLAEVSDLTSSPVDDFVRFVGGDYCASWVGRRGGEQEVWIAPYCPSGSVMHEIGHLLGLEHEHTRPDRDQYIEIHWDNIEPDKRHNFDVAPSGSRLPGAYDYDSIMHYGSHNFSSNGSATITAIGDSARPIGQRSSPSTGDLQAIAQLYGTDLSLTTRSTATTQGTEIDIHVSNESMQGAHDVSVVVDGTAYPEATSSVRDVWNCETNDDEASLLCSLSLLPGSSMQMLTLYLPEYQELQDVSISVTSKTPDLDLSNNTSNMSSDDTEDLPELKPIPDLSSAINDEAVVQEDALAHVAISGGAISVYAWFLILLCLVRQTGCRVYSAFIGYIFCKHWRYLLGR